MKGGAGRTASTASRPAGLRLHKARPSGATNRPIGPSVCRVAILLFLVMDPMSNVPLFVTFSEGIEPRTARTIVLRELLIALAILTLFLFCDQVILEILQVSGVSSLLKETSNSA